MSAPQSYTVVAPGPILRQRRYNVARFLLGAPDLSDKSVEWVVQPEAPDPRDKSGMPPPVSIKRRGGPSFRGVPEQSTASRYFVLTKTGDDFTALPVSAVFTVKPLVRREGPSTLDAAEAEMNAPGAGTALDRALAPRSLAARLESERASAAQEAEFKGVATEEKLQVLFDQVAARRGGDDTDGWDVAGPSGAGRRRGGGRGRGARRSGGGGRGGGDEEDPLAADEVVEDIYQGEEDELRPQAPDEEAEWEFEVAADDDDLDQGAGDEEGYDDDPGQRKKLGLDAEEGEGEEEDEEGKKIQKALAKERRRRIAAGEDGAEDGEGGEEGLEDLESEDLDELVQEVELETGPEGSGGGQGEGGQKPRRRTPPPSNAAAARASPPPSNAAGSPSGAPRGGRRTPPPPAASAAATSSAGTPPPSAPKRKAEDASPGADAKRARADAPAAGGKPPTGRRTPPPAPPPGGARLTPPPPSQQSPGGAAAGAAPGPSSLPAAAQAAGLPTAEEIRELLSRGPLQVAQLLAFFRGRLSSDADKQAFKQCMLRVGRIVKGSRPPQIELKSSG